MLSKPNINELIKKAGNRYEVALSIAKRARSISQRRLERGDVNIKDTVDLAATEIYEEKALVKKNGQYVLQSKNNVLDIDTVISNTVDGILKDLAVKDELLDLEKPKKVRKAKKEEVEEKVTEVAEEKVKVTKKVAKKDKKIEGTDE
ncbi:MAG: DNA-directed RNA polymerase subunit omega [Clostridia bacterium]|nr:DNA-directed RNA polymerase subunit omega [Clostridia bacterium]MDD4386986.1 DNA-directed RNA polymerase subunit omega [Clostridia bacterium]